MRGRAAIVLAALAAGVSRHSLPGDGDVARARPVPRPARRPSRNCSSLLGDPLVALLTVAALAAIAARRAGIAPRG